MTLPTSQTEQHAEHSLTGSFYLVTMSLWCGHILLVAEVSLISLHDDLTMTQHTAFKSLT